MSFENPFGETSPAEAPKQTEAPKKKKTGLWKAIGLAVGLTAGSVMSGDKSADNPPSPDFSDPMANEQVDLKLKKANLQDPNEAILKAEEAKSLSMRKHNKGGDDAGSTIASAE